MLILFDNGTPAPLRYALKDHVVVEATTNLITSWQNLAPGGKQRGPKCRGASGGFARLVTAMTPALQGFLQTLREHEAELRALGVRHASIFGSVARGDAREDSDVDVLVDLDRERPMGLFEYSRLKLHIAELLGNSADVVNRKTLKPLLRDNILHDAVDAF